jgi:hypothetical protein
VYETNTEIDHCLIELGKSTASLLSIQNANNSDARATFVNFCEWYLKTVLASKVSLAEVLAVNIAKTQKRFGALERMELPDFDADYPEEEQLPRRFEIEIFQKASGKSFMRWNGVIIGAPLTDNISRPDGYRFHDVLHFAHAAILHWSPTFRALIKHKRKSNPKVDEAEDGGRAIVVEEGLSAWVFSKAKELELFDQQKTVSMEILKTIEGFVAGYEVSKCPAKLWEKAILEGYSVFREVLKNEGGIIVGDRNERTIQYKTK